MTEREPILVTLEGVFTPYVLCTWTQTGCKVAIFANSVEGDCAELTVDQLTIIEQQIRSYLASTPISRRRRDKTRTLMHAIGRHRNKLVRQLENDLEDELAADAV